MGSGPDRDIRQKIQALLASGRAAEALPLLKAQVRETPDDVLAWANLIRVCEQLNQVAQAAEFVQEAHARGLAHPLIQLAEASVLRRQGELVEAQKKVAECLALNDAPPWFRASSHYEAARIFDAAGQWQKAYEAARDANGYAKPLWPSAWFDDALWRWLEALKRYQPKPNATDDNAPVFLVGYPRSGTTLVHQMLDAHERFQVIDEWPIMEKLAAEVASNWGDLLSPLTDTKAAELRARYWQLAPTSSAIVVDKLPLNLLFWPLIRRLFPNAKIVIVRRHPLDAALSAFMQEFRPHPTLVPFLDMADSIRYWLKLNELVTHIEVTDTGYVRVVEYEALVTEPRSTLTSLMAFLGEPFDERQLKFYVHARGQQQINTPSYHQVVRPIYRSSIGRWRNYASCLPGASIETLKQLIGDRWDLSLTSSPDSGVGADND